MPSLFVLCSIACVALVPFRSHPLCSTLSLWKRAASISKAIDFEVVSSHLLSFYFIFAGGLKCINNRAEKFLKSERSLFTGARCTVTALSCVSSHLIPRFFDTFLPAFSSAFADLSVKAEQVSRFRLQLGCCNGSPGGNSSDSLGSA